MTNEPRASRPYDYWDRSMPPGLDWPWARTRLTEARNYWVAYTRPDGGARTRPVWGVWLDDRFCFDSTSMADGLARDPRVTVHVESGDEVVIVEGMAASLLDDAGGSTDRRRMVEAYNAKYGWDWTAETVPAPFAVRPIKAFGWRSDPSGADRGALFGATGTRWVFDQ